MDESTATSAEVDRNGGMVVRADAAEQVQIALRLGWTLAEFRGRNELIALGADAPIEGVSTPSDRPPHVLALGEQRSVHEREIEVERALDILIDHLGFQVDLHELTGYRGRKGTARDEVRGLCIALREASPESRHQHWANLDKLLYGWDAKIQDELPGRTLALAWAYKLGRGLGEIAWSLHPQVPDAERRWRWMLGKVRRDTLSRYAERLAALSRDYSGERAEFWPR
jgi:hypothetical protein